MSQETWRALMDLASRLKVVRVVVGEGVLHPGRFSGGRLAVHRRWRRWYDYKRHTGGRGAKSGGTLPPPVLALSVLQNWSGPAVGLFLIFLICLGFSSLSNPSCPLPTKCSLFDHLCHSRQVSALGENRAESPVNGPHEPEVAQKLQPPREGLSYSAPRVGRLARPCLGRGCGRGGQVDCYGGPACG